MNFDFELPCKLFIIYIAFAPKWTFTVDVQVFDEHKELQGCVEALFPLGSYGNDEVKLPG